MIEENKPLQEQQNLVARAIREVSGFASMYHRFQRNLSVLGRSARTFEGYGRHLASISLHFGAPRWSYPRTMFRSTCLSYRTVLRHPPKRALNTQFTVCGFY